MNSGCITLDVAADYDYVLIDYSPSLSPLTVMALTAAPCGDPGNSRLFSAWGLMP